ncbi:hypothetical protein, partial [Xylella fastidiosa]|uniref:hypothetical protein n=1 Tax=Xylella fastidiosa TaxID=2371 RepID=UPI0013968195
DLVALAQDVGATHIEQASARAIELELAAPERPVCVAVQPELIADEIDAAPVEVGARLGVEGAEGQQLLHQPPRALDRAAELVDDAPHRLRIG